MNGHIDRLTNLYNNDALKILQRNSIVYESVINMAPHRLMASTAMAQLIDSPVLSNIQRQESLISNIINNPLFETFQMQDTTLRSIYKNPVLEAIQSQESFIQKTFKQPVNSFYRQETALQTFFNSYDFILKQHSIWNQLSAKPLFTSSFSIETFDLAIEKMESLYENIREIEMPRTSLPEIKKDEAKDSLKETIFSTKKLRSIINTLDSKLVWKILDRTATIFTIYSVMFGGLSNTEFNVDLNLNINININVNDSDDPFSNDIHLDGIIQLKEDELEQNIDSEVLIDPGVRS